MPKLYLLFLLFCFSAFAQEKIPDHPKNDERIRAFGLQLSNSFAQQKPKLFLEHVLFKNMYRKVILTDLENKQLTKFNKRFSSDIKNKLASFPKEMITNLNQGDFYNFVSYFYDEIDKTYHLIFRSYSSKTGINYHDYKILSYENKLIIDDVYVYGSNQLLSETLKLFYLSSVSKKDLKSIIEKSDYKLILMLKNYVDAVNSNDAKKAYQHIGILNKSLSYKDRFVAALKLETSHNISEEAYFESMEDILANFNLDPSINLIAIRYHYLNKDYDKVATCLNKLYNHTNDSFLDFEKGNLAYAQQEYEIAINYYKNMIDQYPQFDLPKFSLLMCYERIKSADKAVLLLEFIVKHTGYNKKDLISKAKNQLPFVSKSNSFKKWARQ
ncbi:tetratricopeptide repeat protein [Pseudofulvibacter geojedonensis]|uniref:Tol-pal system YbgF family protein n=1 Tax=Pseudofulvibacter geojedonensis TaxID=1123758 RepID=A0ABW3HZH3_9FLAO